MAWTPTRPLLQLRILRLSGNRLRGYFDVAPFSNLRTLYLDDNTLEGIEHAERLSKLENLSLRNQGGRLLYVYSIPLI